MTGWTNKKPKMKNQIQIQTEASRDAIAVRAYQFWESAGCPLGRDLEYWLQAEAELNATNHRAVVKFVPADADTTSKPARSAAPRKPDNHLIKTTGRMAEPGLLESSRKGRSYKPTQPQV
jgi:hypothetical protein